MALSTRVWRGWLVLIAGLLPLVYLLWLVVRLQMGEWDVLGPEPGRAIVFFTGSWTFNLLLIGLAISPLRRMGVKWPATHRRMVGLITFTYATCHLLAYSAFLLEWHWQEIATELVKRPYLTLGMLAWLLLLPLAVTSHSYWQRRLRQRWKQLHTLVYAIAVLAAIHYLLQIRSNWLEPVLYSVSVALLLAERLWRKQWKKPLARTRVA
jgi:sulfoxide reductase heme-binding subunit YedZ